MIAFELEEITIVEKITCAQTYAVHESYVFPQDLNNNRIQFGGKTLEILDANAGLSAVKFLPSHLAFVTAGYDHVQFLAPITPDDISTCTSYVTGADHKAVEVFSKFNAFDKKTKTTKVAFVAFCTLVVTNPLDEIDFPQLVAETPEEKYLVQTYPDRLAERKHALADNKDLISHLL